MRPSSMAGRTEMPAGWGRRAWIGAGALAGLLIGCTSIRQLPPDAIPESGTGHARVVMRDGYTYGFERVLAHGDSVIGIYHVTEEHVVENQEIAFVEMERRTVLQRGQVAHVEIRHLDASKTVLLGAGAVISGVWLVSLFESETKPVDDCVKCGSLP
jgi:hypothetical protein